MLAPKLEAMGSTDPAKGTLETDDIFKLIRVVGIDDADQQMQILDRSRDLASWALRKPLDL